LICAAAEALPVELRCRFLTDLAAALAVTRTALIDGTAPAAPSSRR
jgi:hypothetical protein